MGMLIFVCFILAGIVMISIMNIRETKSQIGEEGRKTIRAIGVRTLVGGVLLFVGSGAGVIHSQILRRADVGIELSILLYIILGMGILLMGVGRLILRRMELEKETELVVTTLSDCRIMRQRERYWLHHYMVTGVSLEGRQSIFLFYGRDREMIEQAQKMGKKNFVIRYYKNSGRIYDITVGGAYENR